MHDPGKQERLSRRCTCRQRGKPLQACHRSIQGSCMHLYILCPYGFIHNPFKIQPWLSLLFMRQQLQQQWHLLIPILLITWLALLQVLQCFLSPHCNVRLLPWTSYCDCRVLHLLRVITLIFNLHLRASLFTINFDRSHCCNYMVQYASEATWHDEYSKQEWCQYSPAASNV